jgi:hypothetical protein
LRKSARKKKRNFSQSHADYFAESRRVREVQLATENI